jgi:hypothetical protein
MEKWLREKHPKSAFLIKLGNQTYLSPAYEVHHKDENRRHNEIENLECLTPAEHRKLHRDARRS